MNAREIINNPGEYTNNEYIQAGLELLDEDDMPGFRD